MSRVQSLIVGLFLLAALTAAGPASAATTTVVSTPGDPLFDEIGADLDKQGQGFSDPLEGINRQIHGLNQAMDRWALNPIASAYRWAVPEVGRRAVRHVLTNLNSPATLVNDILQLQIRNAAVTTVRFVVNTSAGLAGLFDVGERLGLPGHEADFGQTLAGYGVGSGPFLVLPVLGPTTLRDGTGRLVDVLFSPTTYLLGGSDQVMATMIRGSSSGLAELDRNADNLQMLRESSVDFYAAQRSAYYQYRTAELRSREEAADRPLLASR